MNEKRIEPKRRLLHEVLQDETDVEWAEAARQHALAAFRRGRLFRRIAFLSRLAALFLVLVTGVFLLRTPLTQGRYASQSGREFAPQPKPSGATQAPAPAPLPTLTDDQLLACFPPNTCSLAEVEGRKVLVFADSSARKKYLH
jgi:hypothetical protein